MVDTASREVAWSDDANENDPRLGQKNDLVDRPPAEVLQTGRLGSEA